MKNLLFYSLPRFIENCANVASSFIFTILKYWIEFVTNLISKIEATLRFLFSSPLLIIATIIVFNLVVLVAFWSVTTEESTFFQTLRTLKEERWNVLLRAGLLYIPINWCYNRMLYQTAGEKFTTRVVTVLFSIFFLPVVLGSGGFNLFDMKSGVAILIALRIMLVWQEVLKPKGVHTAIADFFARICAKKYTIVHTPKFRS